MRGRTSSLFGASAIAAMLVLTVPATAQNQGANNTSAGSSTNEPLTTGGNDTGANRGQVNERNANRRRGNANDRANDAGANRGSANDRDGANDTVNDGNDPNKVARAIAKEEAKYRKRVAKVNRLLQIANEQGNPNLAQNANRLRQRIESVHQRKLAKIRAKHGDRSYQNAKDRVNRADANRKQQRANERANRGSAGNQGGNQGGTQGGNAGAANPGKANKAKNSNKRGGGNRNANQGG